MGLTGACGYYRHEELEATEAGCPFCHHTSPNIVDLHGSMLTASVIDFINGMPSDGRPVLLRNFSRPEGLVND